jgi:membrane associated rhomboid family serine protease
MSVTLIITIATVVISFLAMNNEQLMDKLIFHPYTIKNNTGYYRFISSGFIHADFMHLAFNMFSFYMFGDYVEQFFSMLFGEAGKLIYILLYMSSLVACLIPTYFSHKNQYNYYSLGASGAVSAIVFAGIFLQPTIRIGFFIIPPIIPGFIFGPIYLGLTAYLSKQGRGGINHSAHLWGSLYGVVFLIIISYFMGNYNVVASFWEQIKLYLGI